MNIVVLCGGYSTERDVSIKSGSLIYEALRSKGHNAVLIDSYFGYTGEYDSPEEIFSSTQDNISFTIGETDPDLEKIKAARGQSDESRIGSNLIEVCRAADIVFMALHGEDGENGKFQALFDIEGIKYTGSGYLASAIAMNKYLSKKLFLVSGIGTPDSITLNRGESHYENIGFPCVVKPCSGGSSVGTSIVHTESEYAAALALAFKYEDSVLVETYVKGREFTVGILDGKPLPVVEIIPKQGFYDYKNKYQAGLTEELCPAPIGEALTKEIQSLALKAADALMIDSYCRIDFLMDENNKFYCLEANTLPGMTPTSLVPLMAKKIGLDYPDLCEKIISISMQKYE